MYRSSSSWVAVAVGAILFAQAGCDGGGRGTAVPTPGEYFRRNQAPTVTPNGRIKLTTVKEVGDEIRYETADGKRWRVGYSKRADGTYEYRTPAPVE